MLLGTLAGLLLLAACSEKELLSDVEGTWHVQKYVVDSKDRTQYFDTTFRLFKWVFNAPHDFQQTWQYRKIDTALNIHAIFDSVDVNNDTIYHYDTVKVVTPKFVNAAIKGDWYLINSNKFLQTRDSVNGTNSYKIEEHSSGNMKLSRGDEVFYLAQ